MLIVLCVCHNHCAVKFVSIIKVSRPVTIEAENLFQTKFLTSSTSLYCACIILTTSYHMHKYYYAATGDMVKFFLNNKQKLYHRTTCSYYPTRKISTLVTKCLWPSQYSHYLNRLCPTLISNVVVDITRLYKLEI